MPKKKTQEQFVEELNSVNPNLEVVGIYHNSETPISVKCKICNGINVVKPASLLHSPGCPYCSNHKVLFGYNDLTTTAPKDILDEWDYEKNSPLTPALFVAGSHKKVYWKCKKCGNVWPAWIRNRIQQKQGCPKCAKAIQADTFRKNLLKKGKKSLAEERPDITAEWDYIKNGTMSPYDYTINSNKSVYWKCKKCGHEWPAKIHQRTSNNTGCPVCTGHVVVQGINDLASLHPEMLLEWHPTLNESLDPHVIGIGYKEPVWWLCPYGHAYKSCIYDRISKGCGCTECNKRYHTSVMEQTIMFYIFRNFPDALNRYKAPFLKGTEIDIFIPSLKTGIEYDGQRYHKKIEKDQAKDNICKTNGITLIRVREPGCPQYDRKMPTYIMDKIDSKSLSNIITKILEMLLKVNVAPIDINENKSMIMEYIYDHRVNKSIFDLYPDLAEDWHPSLNGKLKPENIPAIYSKEKYWWMCKDCKQPWLASLGERLKGTGCPVCTNRIVVKGINDLYTTNIAIAKEWHPTKNGNFTPFEFTAGSEFDAWWKCSVCGYEYHAKIKKRKYGYGCKKCSQKKHQQTLYKTVYQYDKNQTLLRTFVSSRIAAKELGISRSAIQHACTGLLDTAGGYYWSYFYPWKTTEHTLRIPNRVIQYLDGNIVKIHNSIKEASLETGISLSSIYAACNKTYGRKSAGGFQWEYE